MRGCAALRATEVDATTRAAVHIVVLELTSAVEVREVAEALVRFVRALGGTVVPAREEDGEVLPIDLGFGEVPPMLPAAPPASVARFRLEVVLPAVAAEAAAVVDVLRRRELVGDRGPDVAGDA